MSVFSADAVRAAFLAPQNPPVPLRRRARLARRYVALQFWLAVRDRAYRLAHRDVDLPS